GRAGDQESADGEQAWTHRFRFRLGGFLPGERVASATRLGACYVIPGNPCPRQRNCLFMPHPLRILHVSRSLDMGGQERLLVEFARGADRARFDLRFLSLTSRGPIADRITREGWPVTALEQPEGLRPGLVLRLARAFAGVDVVHTHDDKPLLYA